MSSGEKFEQLVKDIVAKHETAYRNPDVKDVYNMMSMIGADCVEIAGRLKPVKEDIRFVGTAKIKELITHAVTEVLNEL